MHVRLSYLCILAIAPSIPAQTPSGVISGVVRFTGQTPPAQKIPTTDGGTLLHRDLVVDPKTKGLKDVAVIVENAPRREPGRREPIVMDQRDMVFSPRVVTVQEGRKVRFENNDLVNHAVQAFSARDENKFNVTTPQGQPFDFLFKAERTPVVLGCPIHAWMRAYVFILPHPFHAVTDAQGRFEITGLPDGEYFVVFRHPDSGLRDRRTAQVSTGRRATITLEWSKTTGE